jgi:hypothetical protein
MTINRLNQDVTYLPAFRNLIINGAMQVAQRGTSTTGITGDVDIFYTVDRHRTRLRNLGTWTQTVENDAPTGSGFRKSLKMLCTTADAAPAANDLLWIAQNIEGQNLQAIRKGTSDAQQLTLQFWVKANVTGTYIVSLFDFDNTRQVSAAYSIISSGTWEKKTIVFPADTTGVLDNDNAGSLEINWFLGAGTDRTSGTLQTTWAANVNANRAVGQTNLAAATNNYWQVTGVQLEVGAVATPFEFKPIEQELSECQRYLPLVYGLYGVGYSTSANLVRFPAYFVTETRTEPTGVSGTAGDFSIVNVGTPTAIAFRHASKNSCTIDFTFTGVATGEAYYIQGTGKLFFTGCEL